MKYKVKWETELSPARPFYNGESELWLFSDQDLETQARRRIARDGCFSPREIRILNIDQA